MTDGTRLVPGTSLYRFYDDAGRLLYVGITGRSTHRFYEHNREKAWWGEVVSVKVVHFGTRPEAAAAEVAAIRDEAPVHNRTGTNGGAPKDTSTSPGEQIAVAYKRMAVEARYRPAAPNDGFGHITVPLERLDLEREAAEYAVRWLKQEDECTFWIGVPDWGTAKAMVYAVEAARLMCGMREGYPHAATLLRMALGELGVREKAA